MTPSREGFVEAEIRAAWAEIHRQDEREALLWGTGPAAKTASPTYRSASASDAKTRKARCSDGASHLTGDDAS